MWTQCTFSARICATLIAVGVGISHADTTETGLYPTSHEQAFSPPVAALTNFQLLVLSLLEQLESILVDDEPLPFEPETDGQLQKAALHLIERYQVHGIDPTLLPAEAAEWATVASFTKVAVSDQQCGFDQTVLAMMQLVLTAMHAELNELSDDA